MRKQLYFINLQAMIAATYVVLLWVFQFMSFNAVQFRIAELLLILVLFSPKNAIGIIIGTFLGNMLLSPYGIIDAGFGTLATTVSILLMLPFRKIWPVALLMPVIVNAFIVPLYVIYFFFGLDIGFFDLFTYVGYYVFAGWVALGQFVVIFGLGVPTYYFLNKNEFIVEALAV